MCWSAKRAASSGAVMAPSSRTASKVARCAGSRSPISRAADDVAVRIEFAAPEHVAAGADEELELFGDCGGQVGHDGIDVRQRLPGIVAKADHGLAQERAVATSTPVKSRNAGVGASAEGVAAIKALSSFRPEIAPERTVWPSIRSSSRCCNSQSSLNDVKMVNKSRDVKVLMGSAKVFPSGLT